MMRQEIKRGGERSIDERSSGVRSANTSPGVKYASGYIRTFVHLSAVERHPRSGYSLPFYSLLLLPSPRPSESQQTLRPFGRVLSAGLSPFLSAVQFKENACHCHASLSIRSYGFALASIYGARARSAVYGTCPRELWHSFPN